MVLPIRPLSARGRGQRATLWFPSTSLILRFLTSAPLLSLVVVAVLVIFQTSLQHGGEESITRSLQNEATMLRGRELLTEHALVTTSSHATTVGSPKPWQSKNSAVLGLATGFDFEHLENYKTFVDSLRATRYSGHIILGISPDAPSEILNYLKSQDVTIHFVEDAEKCTFDGYIGNEGIPIDMKANGWHCPKDYPDYKLMWARFFLYKDWLKACPACTDGIMLTDVRDAYFQADPFLSAIKLGQQHPLMVFEEITGTGLDNTHCLTDVPIKTCLNYTLGPSPMLCAGSVMGSREGIFDYLNVMTKEMDDWKVKDNCRINIGDDQAIHNFLYYTNQLKNARAFPHRTGPINVAGYEAAILFEKALEAANMTEELRDSGGMNDFYVKDGAWHNWLPEELGLIDPVTGLLVNLNGIPSAQVHQYDRFNELSTTWLKNMREKEWPYNKPVQLPS